MGVACQSQLLQIGECLRSLLDRYLAAHHNTTQDMSHFEIKQMGDVNRLLVAENSAPNSFGRGSVQQYFDNRRGIRHKHLPTPTFAKDFSG